MPECNLLQLTPSSCSSPCSSANCCGAKNRGVPTEDTVHRTKPLTPARIQTGWHRTVFDPQRIAKRTDFSSQGWSKGSSMTPCSTGTRISCATVEVAAGCTWHIPALVVSCPSGRIMGPDVAPAARNLWMQQHRTPRWASLPQRLLTCMSLRRMWDSQGATQDGGSSGPPWHLHTGTTM